MLRCAAGFEKCVPKLFMLFGSVYYLLLFYEILQTEASAKFNFTHLHKRTLTKVGKCIWNNP